MSANDNYYLATTDYRYTRYIRNILKADVLNCILMFILDIEWSSPSKGIYDIRYTSQHTATAHDIRCVLVE